MEYYSAFFFYIYLRIWHAYWQTLWPPFLHRGLSQLGIRDDIFHVPICDAGVNIVVKLCRGPEISSWKQRELPLPLVWFRSRATERPWEDRPKSYVSSFSYTSSQMWELTPAVRDELYRVTPPYDLCWASSMLLKSTSLTRCQPCLTLWAQEFHLDGGVCWNSLSAHRPPDVPASSSVCCSFGAQVSPHLLTSCWHIGGFYLSKDSGCVFRHMALHFRLFWQPNMIPQPILAGIKL